MGTSKQYLIKKWLETHKVPDTTLARLAANDHSAVRKLRQGIISDKALDKLYNFIVTHPNGIER